MTLSTAFGHMHILFNVMQQTSRRVLHDLTAIHAANEYLRQTNTGSENIFQPVLERHTLR